MGMRISDLEPPILLLDINRARENIERYQEIANREKVRLRPHGKTTKLPYIWKIQQDAGAKGMTVATLHEAEEAIHGGIDDLFIALPYVDENSLERISSLCRHNIISLLVANQDGAKKVTEYFTHHEPIPSILAAIDTGLHREGFDPKDDRDIQVLQTLQRIFKEKFLGISTHEGHVYRARRNSQVQRIARETRDKMIHFKRKCEASGLSFREVQIGATPTFPYFKRDRKRTITETHPGNYVLMDLTQVRLGVASPRECALSVLGTVIGSRITEIEKKTSGTRRVGRLFVHPGGKMFSEARRPHGIGTVSYGKLYTDLSAKDLEGAGDIIALSEEIAWVDVPPSQLAHWKIGEKVRILVQHACPTIAANRSVTIVDGEEVVERIPISAGGH